MNPHSAHRMQTHAYTRVGAFGCGVWGTAPRCPPVPDDPAGMPPWPDRTGYPYRTGPEQYATRYALRVRVCCLLDRV